MQDGLTNYGDNTLFWFKNSFRSKLDHKHLKFLIYLNHFTMRMALSQRQSLY